MSSFYFFVQCLHSKTSSMVKVFEFLSTCHIFLLLDSYAVKFTAGRQDQGMHVNNLTSLSSTCRNTNAIYRCIITIQNLHRRHNASPYLYPCAGCSQAVSVTTHFVGGGWHQQRQLPTHSDQQRRLPHGTADFALALSRSVAREIRMPNSVKSEAKEWQLAIGSRRKQNGAEECRQFSL